MYLSFRNITPIFNFFFVDSGQKSIRAALAESDDHYSRLYYSGRKRKGRLQFLCQYQTFLVFPSSVVLWSRVVPVAVFERVRVLSSATPPCDCMYQHAFIPLYNPFSCCSYYLLAKKHVQEAVMKGGKAKGACISVPRTPPLQRQRTPVRCLAKAETFVVIVTANHGVSVAVFKAILWSDWITIEHEEAVFLVVIDNVGRGADAPAGDAKVGRTSRAGSLLCGRNRVRDLGLH